MQILDWEQLDLAGRQAALRRPAAINSDTLFAQVRAIVETVRRDGDAALRRYTLQFDGASLAQLRVDASEFAAARAQLSPDALSALRTAIANVTTFHRAQWPTDIRVEIQPGVCCERLVRPIQAVGLYVPAGSAPLPSTAIMLAVPAQLAQCPRRVLCTPPRSDGRADAAILVAAQLCGIEQVYKVGGAQAIAAMAYGTDSIPKVAKIFGPGNRWVAAAKQIVASDPDGAALDLPAGPSEVLVLADESADAQFVAADLLAQAEHDASAQALLVTTSVALAERVAHVVRERAPLLGRNAILRESLQAARLIVVRDLQTAVQIAEQYAPEHLLIQTRAPRELLGAITTAGSVFLGRWTPETMGDYCSGTNHVLPTNGHARAYSGLGLSDFLRSMTVQELTVAGLQSLGPVAARLARLENLDAHAAAVELRLAALRERAAAGGVTP
jgi:histidinol dehydrogenase